MTSEITILKVERIPQLDSKAYTSVSMEYIHRDLVRRHAHIASVATHWAESVIEAAAGAENAAGMALLDLMEAAPALALKAAAYDELMSKTHEPPSRFAIGLALQTTLLECGPDVDWCNGRNIDRLVGVVVDTLTGSPK